jgi:hypothetical protein
MNKVTIFLFIIFQISASQEEQVFELSGNNIQVYFKNDGRFIAYDKGLIFPSVPFSENEYDIIENRIPITTTFASGLRIGGKVNGEIRSSKVLYQQEDFKPGIITYIDSTGRALYDNTKKKVYYYFSDKYIDFIQSILLQTDSNQKRYKYAVKQLNLINSEKDLWNEAVEFGAPTMAPGDIATFHLFHDADISSRDNYYESRPLNIQVNQLNWLYIESSTKTLDNCYFTQLEFINKSEYSNIDSIFVGIYSDVDIGYPTDDKIGSDYKLGLGYVYNAQMNDQFFQLIELTPPAFGIDILQGPIVSDSNSTILITNKQNLFAVNANSSNYFLNEKSYIEKKKILTTHSVSSNWTEYHLGIYNYLKAESHTQRVAQNNAINLGLTTKDESKFIYNGDPLEQTGWIDNYSIDKRLLISIGPFDLNAYRDKNQNGKIDFSDDGYNKMIYTTIHSTSTNNLLSVDQLKKDAVTIKSFFKNGMHEEAELPKANLSVSSDKKSILLNWREGNILYTDINDVEKTISTETYSLNDFKFQGYQVVQFYNEEQNRFKEIKVFDISDDIQSYPYNYHTRSGKLLKRFLNGENSGIKNSFQIQKDFISNLELTKAKNYYFGIRAYALSPSGIKFSNWAKTGRVWLDLNRDLAESLIKLPYELINGHTKNIDFTVIDPDKLKDSEYEIRFNILKEDK